MAEQQLTAAAPRRTAAKGATIVVIIAMALAALVYSNSFAARRVLDDARLLDATSATLGVNALTVKSLSQALLLAEDVQLEVAEASTLEAALDEARSLLGELSVATQAVSTFVSEDEFEARAQAAVAAGDRVVDLVDQGQVAAAGLLLSGDALTAFEALRDGLQDHHDATVDRVESSSGFISGLGSLPAFLVSFLVPAAAILIYRRIAKGQLRVAEAQLDARLEAEQKIVVAKDDFVASISHELRTPLTSIYGFSEVLLDQGLVDPASASELLGLINSESAELHRMVEDLLAIARSEAGTIAFQIGEVDLSEELSESQRAVGRAGVHLDVNLETDKVWADPGLVKQILRNLLSNAQHHGGDHVHVSSVERGDTVDIIVADDGPGVPAAKAPQLFTRYIHEGEDPLTRGSVGVGLAVVRILVEGMAGSARYERSDGWSRFVVTLPARAPTEDVPTDVGQGLPADMPEARP